MGIEYYLVRDDDRTLYALGKGTGSWGSFMGRRDWEEGPGSPMTIVDAGALASLMHEAAQVDEWDLDVATLDYFIDVATDVVRWSGGMPVRFVDEHNDPVDRMEDGGWRITGSRYRS